MAEARRGRAGQPPRHAAATPASITCTPDLAKETLSTSTKPGEAVAGPRRAFLGRFVDTPRLGEVRGLSGDGRGLLVVGADGLIESVVWEAGPDLDKKLAALQEAKVPVQELREREFLVPGFIDSHIHFPQFPYTGTGVDRPLMAADGFLAKYAFPTEKGMVDTAWAQQVYTLALRELLRFGTTTAVIYGSMHLDASKALVDAALACGGPRSCVGKVCMDRYSPEGYVETTEASLRDTEEFIRYTQAKTSAHAGSRPCLVQPVVTPRFLPTCTPELLAGLGELAARYDCMVQSHMSESCDEVSFSASLFPGQTDAAAFSSFGLLRAPSVMGHCVHLMPEEDEILTRHGAAIAHCPLSNFFFAKEALPVKQLLRRGVRVALGTDVAGGYSPSMMNAMRMAVLASKTLQFRRAPGCVFRTSAEMPRESSEREQQEVELRNENDLSHFEALYLATQGGAEALCLGDKLGSFEVGKAFDAVLLAAEPPTVLDFGGPVEASAEDLLQKIITLGDDRNVREVFVGGVRVWQAPVIAAS